MRKHLTLICLLLFTILCPAASWGQATLDATVKYTEPSTQACTPLPCLGLPLNQLEYTTLYFEVRDEGGVSLEQWTEQTVATSGKGGGNITYTLPARPVPNNGRELFIWASATNPIGESVKSGPVVKPLPAIDIGVPSGPIDLEVTISIKVSGS